MNRRKQFLELKFGLDIAICDIRTKLFLRFEFTTSKHFLYWEEMITILVIGLN